MIRSRRLASLTPNSTLFGRALAQLSRALEVLERSLHHHRWLALPAVSADTLVYNASDDGASPPYSLMDHPPVAVFTNGAQSFAKRLGGDADTAAYSKLCCFVAEGHRDDSFPGSYRLGVALQESDPEPRLNQHG